MGTLHYNNISLDSSYNKKVSWQKLQRKSKHTFYVQKFFPEKCAVYEITWKNMVHATDANTVAHKKDAVCLLDN
jgi:hypothetical protein